jgi:hypothetical protein
MDATFAAVGHKYRVDFSAFRVQLYFASTTPLTHYNFAADGSVTGSETASIKVDPIADQIFLPTWQGSDKTTVVHVENYSRKTIVTTPDLAFSNSTARSHSCRDRRR